MRVEGLQLGLDPDFVEIVAIRRLVDRSDVQHGLCSFDGPPHPASFHSIFHQMTAGIFDHTRRDWIAGFQVFVILHATGVVREVTTHGVNFLRDFVWQLLHCRHPPQAGDHAFHVTAPNAVGDVTVTAQADDVPNFANDRSAGCSARTRTRQSCLM